MPLQHYLPATFLANFSPDKLISDRRKSKIWMADKKTGQIKLVPASKAGAINDFYTLKNPKSDPLIVDNLWSEIENQLPPALEKLLNHKLDAKTWVRILVPFIACLLVRGPDFNKRFSSRIEALINGSDFSDEEIQDQINGARIMELQRLLSPVMVSKWVLIKVNGSDSLLTNDLGYSVFRNARYHETGIAIPINSEYVLSIIPKYNNDFLIFNKGKWLPIIHYSIADENNHDLLNQALVRSANRFVFSPSKELLIKYLPDFKYQGRLLEPGQLGFFDGPIARAFEFTWHRLAIAIEKDVQNRYLDDFPLLWEILLKGWCPRVIIPDNLVPFPAPIKRTGKKLKFEMYDPSIYYTLSRVYEFRDAKLFREMLNEANIGFQSTQDQNLKNKFLLLISDALFDLEEKKLSYQVLDFLIEFFPNNLDARINRAANLMIDHNLNEGFADLQFILKRDNTSPHARINLCSYYTQIEEFNKAIIHGNFACKHSPKGVILGQAYLSRGLAHKGLGQINNAFFDFTKAMENIYEPEKYAYCQILRSICGFEYLKNNMSLYTERKSPSLTQKIDKFSSDIKSYTFENALYDLDHGFRRSENKEVQLLVLHTKAEIYYHTNRMDKALPIFKALKAIEPLSLQYQFAIGEIYLMQGRFLESINENTDLIKINPDIGGAYNNRAISKLFLGYIHEAKKDFLIASKLIQKHNEKASPIRHLVHIALLENKLIHAKKLCRYCLNIDTESYNNILLIGLISLYSGYNKFSLFYFNKYSKKYPRIPEFTIYKILPLIKVSRLDTAKLIKTKYWDRIPIYTRNIVNLHINHIQKMVGK